MSLGQIKESLSHHDNSSKIRTLNDWQQENSITNKIPFRDERRLVLCIVVNELVASRRFVGVDETSVARRRVHVKRPVGTTKNKKNDSIHLNSLEVQRFFKTKVIC
jgi:hypothetical protein